MKLRNKKTGKIVDVESLGHAESLKEKYGYQVTLSWKTEYENLSQCKDYDSLAELNEEWEDYEPKEPLIKDEKIRKAVRAWAEAFGVTNAYVVGIGDGKDYIELYAQDNGVTDGRIRMSISTQNGVWIGKEYTITKLCGEEEE